MKSHDRQSYDRNMAPVKASVLFCAVIVLFLQTVAADTPANCTYEDIVGKWTFGIGKGGFDNSLKCDDVGKCRDRCLRRPAGVLNLSLLAVLPLTA